MSTTQKKEVAEAIVPQESPVAPTVVPFKVISQAVGVYKDAEGNIIGETKIGEFVLYESQFDRFPELVEAVYQDFLKKQSN